MHGQAKVKTTADEQEKKRKQRLEKVKQYRMKMDQFYSKRKDKIYDDESVNLINDILSTQPDVATLWNYKKEILLHFLSTRDEAELAKILDSELRVTEGCLRVNPKSYCSWYHREWLLTHFPNPNLERELKLCTAYLKLDDRNFHCWDYRRWIVAKSGVSDNDELAYTTSKIEDNFSNYSAWHYRSKLLPRVHPHPTDSTLIDPEVQLSELDLVVNAAFTDPADQSAWFYQRWLVRCGSLKPGVVPITALKRTGSVYITFAAPVTPAQVTVTSSCGILNTSPLTSNVLVCKTDDNVAEINVSVKDLGEWSLSFSENGIWFTPELPERMKTSSALAKVLTDQLAMCDELLTLEPNSKWTLLTTVHLMLAIDKSKYLEEVVRRLNRLKEVDPYRINYYSDLMSSELMEKVVRQCWPPSEISFEGLGLRCLPWSHYLLSVTSINLSGNLLGNSALPALKALVACKKLKLNQNEIGSLNSFPPISQLENLEMDDNCVECNAEEIIAFFKKLPSLSSLAAKNNPATELINRIAEEKSLSS